MVTIAPTIGALTTGMVTGATAVTAGTGVAVAAGTAGAKTLVASGVKYLVLKKILAGAGCAIAGGGLAALIVVTGGVAAEEIEDPLSALDFIHSPGNDLFGEMSEFYI